MKMHKYTAPDMRTALRQVRAAHGPDVVILATRRAEGQVELTVAADPEAVAHAASVPMRARAAGGAASPVGKPAAAVPAATGGSVSVIPSTAIEPSPTPDFPAAVVPALAPTIGPSAASPTAVDAELRALRRLLETQLTALAWNDLTRRAPVAAELLRQLAEIGLDRALAAAIVDAVPPGNDLELAREAAIGQLRMRLAVTGDRWTEQGGTVVMVGAAGSGKTNAVAAIAARWVLRHGTAGAALVSAGETRFGAYDQLARLGRLLGLPTYSVDDLAELPSLLARLRSERLVLVDTGAPRARDGGIESQGGALAALQGEAQVVVTLSATTQAGALRDAAARYARLGASACIATRLDEATSLGGLVSAAAGVLPVAYCVEGTRIPDDLRPARAEDLVSRAFALAERHGAAADEELLARRLGGRLHAAG